MWQHSSTFKPSSRSSGQNGGSKSILSIKIVTARWKTTTNRKNTSRRYPDVHARLPGGSQRRTKPPEMAQKVARKSLTAALEAEKNRPGASKFVPGALRMPPDAPPDRMFYKSHHFWTIFVNLGSQKRRKKLEM